MRLFDFPQMTSGATTISIGEGSGKAAWPAQLHRELFATTIGVIKTGHIVESSGPRSKVATSLRMRFRSHAQQALRRYAHRAIGVAREHGEGQRVADIGNDKGSTL
jgi:hypothetical protein